MTYCRLYTISVRQLFSDLAIDFRLDFVSDIGPVYSLLSFGEAGCRCVLKVEGFGYVIADPVGFQLETGPFTELFQGPATGKDTTVLPDIEDFLCKLVEGSCRKAQAVGGLM